DLEGPAPARRVPAQPDHEREGSHRWREPLHLERQSPEPARATSPVQAPRGGEGPAPCGGDRAEERARDDPDVGTGRAGAPRQLRDTWSLPAGHDRTPRIRRRWG